MRRILAAIVFTLTLSILVPGQTGDGQVMPGKANQELISLSREFVDSAISKEIIELEDASGSTRLDVRAASVSGKWESIVLENIKVRLDGDRAVVTGQVAFKGQTRKGKPLSDNSDLTIHFSRQKGQWKLVKGCLGRCD
jgi:hypothetical protein